MKIWFIATWWPTRVHPTHGNFVEKHARLVAETHDLTVVTVQEDPAQGVLSYQVENLQKECIRQFIVYYGVPSGGVVWVKPVLRAIAYLFVILRAFRASGRPDLLHGHILVDGGILAAVLGLVWQLPVVITEHSTRLLDSTPLPQFRSWLARWACRRAHALMPVSQYLSRAMQSLHGLAGNYVVVGNVVDQDLFVPKDRASSDSNAVFRLLHVSNFREIQKNITGILQAFSILHHQNPGHYHLHLAGDGDRNFVSTVAESYQIDPAALKISGPYTEKQIASLMQKSDAFIMFSHYETQGVVLLEALHAGLPCISSRLSAVEEFIVDGKNGYLVTPGDVNSLVEGISKLKAEARNFDGKSIRADIIGTYGKVAVASALLSVYDDSVHAAMPQ